MTDPKKRPRALWIGVLALPLLAAAAWFANPLGASSQDAATEEPCCDTEEQADAKAVAQSEEANARRAKVRIPDRVLLDQDGNEVRLYSDLIRGKKVIIDFVFTTCTSVCPTLQSVFEGVQDELGDRLGKDVILISVSVDPGNDTPERMKAFAQDFNARPGWYFLTGDQGDIDDVLQAFGVYTKTKEEHTAMFVLGNEPTGRWMYQSGFVDPKYVLKQLEAICAAD